MLAKFIVREDIPGVNELGHHVVTFNVGYEQQGVGHAATVTDARPSQSTFSERTNL
jgi:hypothetical protein